jgi:Bifunctional DNA primase/polymerase, N-terminal
MKTETPAAGEAAGAATLVQGEPKTTAPPASFQPPDRMLEAARRYASLGWFIFPLRPINPDGTCGCNDPKCGSIGKHPAIRWKLGASNDPAVVQEWWSGRFAGYGIGCATGPSGLAVFDLDGPEGLRAVLEILKIPAADPNDIDAMLAALPRTMRSRTARGWHLFFRAPPGGIKTGSDPTRKLDTRGVGGFVVLPPSPHRSTHVYVWEGSDALH